ncbi:17423_t:CDS:2, partial [Racocetra fulgida]
MEIPEDLELFFETLNLTSSTMDLGDGDDKTEFGSKSSDEGKDTTDEESERHQIAINKLINKLKLCYLYAFYRLRRWVQEKQSMLPRPHKNIGHSPVNKLPVKTVGEVKSFIKSVREQH